MRVFSTGPGLTEMPCGCDISEARVFENGEELQLVVGIDTELGIVWQCRRAPREVVPSEPQQWQPPPGFPIINGCVIEDENGNAKLFPRRGKFVVRCDVHGENPTRWRPLAIAKLDLNEKAYDALKRRFTAGIVTADCEASDAPFIGARALDLEFTHANLEPCLALLGRDLNKLADAGFIVGVRSGPNLIRRRHMSGVIVEGVEMRVMIAPGKFDTAAALLLSDGGKHG